MKTVVCTKCNWTHFAVSKEHAEDEVKRFNGYFYSLPEEKRIENYGNKPSTLDNYKCWCGSSSFKEGNTAPNGSTISGVIYEEPK